MRTSRQGEGGAQQGGGPLVEGLAVLPIQAGLFLEKLLGQAVDQFLGQAGAAQPVHQPAQGFGKEQGGGGAALQPLDAVLQLAQFCEDLLAALRGGARGRERGAGC